MALPIEFNYPIAKNRSKNAFSFSICLSVYCIICNSQKSMSFYVFSSLYEHNPPCKIYVTIMPNPLSPPLHSDMIALFKAATEYKIPDCHTNGKGESCHVEEHRRQGRKLFAKHRIQSRNAAERVCCFCFGDRNHLQYLYGHSNCHIRRYSH